MSDIVARLRETRITLSLAPLCAEAASEITRLRAELDALRSHREHMKAWQRQLAEYLGADDGATNDDLLRLAEHQRQWMHDKMDELATMQNERDATREEVAAVLKAERNATLAALRSHTPYGERCRDPLACHATGRCPRDPVCGD